MNLDLDLARLGRLLLTGLCLAGSLHGLGHAQEGDAASREELRERWASKTPEERRLLRDRFEVLRAMDPDTRQRMHDRARKLRRLEHSLKRQTSEQDRRRIDALPPREARAHWRERTHAKGREMGRELRDRLPADVRERLERMPPSERRAFLEGLRMGSRESRSRRAVEDMGRRLGLSDEQIRRHEALPLEERMNQLFSLQRRHIEKRVQEQGLPGRMDESTWRRLQELSDAEFVHALRPHLPRHGDRRAGGPRPHGRFPGKGRPQNDRETRRKDRDRG